MPPPADYDARALALPVSPPPEEQRRPISPAWQRRSSSQQPGPRSHQHQYHRGRPSSDLRSRMLRQADKLSRQGLSVYRRLSPVQRVLLALAGVATIVLGVLFLVYNETIFKEWLAPVAKKWRDLRGGWLIVWAMTFVVSFPPLIGYSSCVMIAGFVYGFPNGWFIVSTATIVGSTASFIVTRAVLHRFVSRLIANDPRFAAIALTLKHDGLKLLIMIRLCPLPYSLSNGAIATFPTVHWGAFALATAIVSPKLLLHVFVGAKIGELAERGEEMDAKTKAISYISIAIGLAAGIATGWLMYRKTKQRAAELEQEEREGAGRRSADSIRREYADDPEAGLAAEVIREQEDDISLRDAFADEYRDDAEELDLPDDLDVGASDEDEGRK